MAGQVVDDDPDHPHYHHYEDEVCLKCDNAQLLRNQEAKLRTTSDQVSPREMRRSGEHVPPRVEGGHGGHLGHPPPQYVEPGRVSPRLSRNVQSEGCDFDGGDKPRHPPTHVFPPPAHVRHVSYPGYPTVSVQDYTNYEVGCLG